MNEDEVDYPQRMRIEWYKDKTADINLAEKQTGGKRKENECEQLNRNYFKDKLKDYRSEELDNIFENNEKFMNPFSDVVNEIE